MKRIVCLICALLMVVLAFSSCGDDVPNGFKLASDPETDGFTLYVPEDWYVTRTGKVVIANVSGLSSAAVTVARTTTDKNLLDYWQEAVEETKAMTEDYTELGEVKVEAIDGCPTLIYEYTATFPDKLSSFRVRQYLISTPDDMVVVTYSAGNTEKEITGTIDFDASVEYFEAAMQYFKPGRGGAETPDLGIVDEDTPEGMKLASINEHAGMTVYVPEAWKVTMSDGFIGVLAPDGKSTISMSTINMNSGIAGTENLYDRMDHYGIERFYEENEDGIYLVDYWNLLQKEYADYYDDGTFHVTEQPTAELVEKDGEKTVVMNPYTDLDYTRYYKFAYTASRGGVDYEVSLYVFMELGEREPTFRTLTYTTRVGEHDTYLEDVETILNEVRY